MNMNGNQNNDKIKGKEKQNGKINFNVAKNNEN